NSSATREVARHRDDPDQLSELVAGVIGAKAALTVVALVVALPVSLLVAPIHRYQSLFWPAMVWALSLSFSLNWFFQGLERMGFVSRWVRAARCLALAGSLLAVRSPADTWKVLAIQGGTMSAAVLIEFAVTYREVRFQIPTARAVARTLRLGWSTFLYQGALSFYTTGNGFLLGLFGTPAAVGYYVGAERISKAFSTLLFPITQAVFPRIRHLASHARGEAARLLNVSLAIILVPHYLEVGMAVAVVASETLVAFGLYAVLRMKNLDPIEIAAWPVAEDPMPATTGAAVQP